MEDPKSSKGASKLKFLTAAAGGGTTLRPSFSAPLGVDESMDKASVSFVASRVQA